MDYFNRRLAARDDDLPAISGLNRALWSVIAKALRSEPKMRQGDSSALYDDIARYFTSGEGVDDDDIDFSNTLATDMSVVDRLLAERATPVQPEPLAATSVKHPPGGSGLKMALLGVGVALSVWLLVLLAGLV